MATIVEPEDYITDLLRVRMTDPQSRVSDFSESFSGDGSTTTFTFTTPRISCISSISVGGTSQVKYTDYTYDLRSGTITFSSAPAEGMDNIAVTGKQGGQNDLGKYNDWIFHDLPRGDLRANSYPRIGVKVTNEPKMIMGSYDVEVQKAVTAFRIEIAEKEGNGVQTISSEACVGEAVVKKLGRLVNKVFEDNLSDIAPVLWPATQDFIPRSQLLPYDGIFERHVYVIEVLLEGFNVGE